MEPCKYYWLKMRLGIINHVPQCLSCARNKGTTSTDPIVQYPTPARLFETIAIDLLQIHKSHQGSTYVLVCVDNFISYVVLASLPKKSATIVVHALV